MELPAFFKTRTGTVLLHILAWMVFYARDLYGYAIEEFQFSTFCIDMSDKFLVISSFYLFFYWVWPQILKPGKYLMIIPGILIGVGYFIAGRYLIQEVLFPATLGFSDYFIEYACLFAN